MTFNYDTILDVALEDMSLIRTKDMDSYVSGSRGRLVKVHGSVSWWRAVQLNREFNLGIDDWWRAVVEEADESNTSATITPFRNTDTVLNGMQPHAPAIAIPVEKKDESVFECPFEHLAALRQWLDEADRLLIIGWRGQEQHFLDLVSSSKMKLKAAAAVSGSTQGAYDVLNHVWTTVQNKRPDFDAPDVWPYDGFSSLIASHPWEFLSHRQVDRLHRPSRSRTARQG